METCNNREHSDNEKTRQKRREEKRREERREECEAEMKINNMSKTE
jgi:hypothetical protein